ncbi:helix-turn-helix domain-containing protein [Rhodococcus sp. IEGM 1379]|uniref:helix-turn-helix domain-containing protein n=1 Tax=Rhodococcus sp. IEGM 1379 TaxID=3047086 RepID=UPI0024B716AF|nr:helix-turn-helix domain-containing protein [Rhodococcus sp. IEGM 1379]MDI9916846.1 helix-turn-helix domain-containing protein [Rhodococcus sp. IEGM 1379]
MGSKALGFTVEQENLIWDLHRRGESLGEIERVLGVTMPRIRRFLRESGGIRLVPGTRRAGHITAGEREEVSRGIAACDSARTIAESLGRSPSTIARDFARNGGRENYGAVEADAAAYVRARRPKLSILCAPPILRETVTEKLHEQWSPQQIAVWLWREYPDDPQMRASHETIYRCLYIPSRKVVDSNVFHELRTDRPIRRSRGKKRSHGRGRIRTMVDHLPEPATCSSASVADLGSTAGFRRPADLPTCRPADLPTCRPADLPTCRLAVFSVITLSSAAPKLAERNGNARTGSCTSTPSPSSAEYVCADH